MTESELIALAIRMRNAQKRYFVTREKDALVEAKVLEREFDKEAENIGSNQGRALL